MLLREVYERTPDFEARVAGASFRTYEWQFLAKLDGKSPVADIIRRLGIEESAIADFITEQERQGTIVPRLLSYEEFLDSPEVGPAAQPAPSRSGDGSTRRSSGDELRAIARLALAAAIGEILAMLSRRRTPQPGTTETSAPVAFDDYTVAEPYPDYDATNDVALGYHELAVEREDFGEPAPLEPPAELRFRHQESEFKVFDWTLPSAEPAEGSEVPQDEAAAPEDVRDADGLTIADRLMRDYGPLGSIATPPPESHAARVPEASHVSFSVGDENEPEATESADALDPAATDPIVFSLSARNPDTFWSGKK